MEEVPDVDYLDVCLEEIALEGLDGITLSALWIRLINRPNFQLTLDDASKSFLWSVFVLHCDLDFFVLNEPRRPLIIYNRFSNIDPETGLVLDLEEPIEDIYPFCMINDGDVRGSCSTYHSRRKVTDEVRTTTEEWNESSFMTLDEVMKLWGDSFVIVATPERRRQNLMGPEINPNLQLVPLQYALLERIGRSRYLGEVTLGSNGLLVIHSCAKTLFYHRKVLIKNHLITKQVHHQYTAKSEKSQLKNGMLFHLTRFYIERKSKIYHFYQELVKYLLSKPNRVDTVPSVLSFLGVQHRSLRKEFQKNMKKVAELYYESVRNWDPQSTPSEWYTSTKKEKKVQLIRLYDHVSIEDLQSILDDDLERQDEDEDEEDDDEDDDGVDDEDNEFDINSIGGRKTLLPLGVLDRRNVLLDRPLLNQAYDMLLNAGSEGMSERELGTALGVPRLEGRAICRKLVRLNAVKKTLIDKGRQKFNSFMAACYVGNSQQIQGFIEEGEKLLEYVPRTELAPSTSVVQKPSRNTFLDDIRNMCRTGNSKDLGNSSTFITLRFLKRANLILKTVYEAKLIECLFVILKVIVNSELHAGCRIDKKTMLRILNHLCRVRLLKSIKSILKQGNCEKQIHFICVPWLTSTDPLVLSALDHAKIKYFTIPRAQQAAQPVEQDSIQQSSSNLRNLTNTNNMIRVGHIPQNGTIYGYKPKFVRMKVLHQYLFYLVYDYGGKLIDTSDSEYPKELQTLLTNESVRVPPLYQTEKSWKMFLSPLPTHVGWKSGWCLFSDILLRLPLCFLVKLLNVNFKIDGLEKYLDHPIMRNFPITHLPSDLRAAVLFARKYIHTIYETATRLGFLGIMSFNQLNKLKDQSFFYLHRHARIVDTTTSMPEFHTVTPGISYPVQYFEFNSSAVVDLYWGNLESISINTPLGTYSKFDINTAVVDVLGKKPEMAATIASKKDEDIVDNGTIPGDGKGAGGLDSSFFAHVKRNWNWTSVETHGAKNEKVNKRFIKTVDRSKPKAVIVKFLDAVGNMPPNPRKRLTRLAISNQLAQLTKDTRQTPKKIVPRKKYANRSKRTKQFVPRTERVKRPKQPYYDEKDLAALNLLTKIRVSWSAKEDSLLLILKVASCLLEPNRKNHMVVPFTVVRDLLHKHVEHSKNKTSRACQRRIRYMMLNNETTFNVSVFLGESRDDKIIKEICSKSYVPMTDYEERVKRFEAVVNRLLDRFKCTDPPIKMRNFKLPDTLEQLSSSYNVVLSHELLNTKKPLVDVKDVADIHFCVVYALILSSVGSLNDQTNWGNIMYRIYQQYPESLLNRVLAKLRSDLILSKHKGKKRVPIDRATLLSFPFRLSNRFQYLFLSSFRENVFKESYDMIRNLVKVSEDGDRKSVELGVDETAGSAATIVSLIAGRRIKLDMNIPENIVSLKIDNDAINKHGQEFLKNFYRWEKVLKPENVTNDDIAMKGNGDETTTEPPKKKAKFDESQVSTSNVLTSHNEFEIQDVYQAIVKLNSSSRFALYMVRSQITEPMLKMTTGVQDSLVINACLIKCSLDLKDCVLFQDTEPPLINKLFSFVPEDEPKLESVVQKYKSMNLNEISICEMKQLQEYLHEKRELGATYAELKESIGSDLKTLDLRRHLEVLVDCFLVLKVGLATVRYVLSSHARPWLLHTYRDKSSEVQNENLGQITEQTNETVDGNVPSTRSTDVTSIRHLKPVKCICRPWRKPNGDLNRPILNEMLHSVMSHIMCYPGTSYEAICTKYASVLSPVDLLELLKILEDAQCIYRNSVKCSHKPSLFSPPVTIAISELSRNEDEVNARYHPKIDCVINLGQIMYSS